MGLGFVIMQIGNTDLDRIFEDILTPAMTDCGLDVRRVDRDNEGGLLKAEIMSLIEESEIIVADLTNERPNCYLEVGYAMGLGKNRNLLLDGATRPPSGSSRPHAMASPAGSITISDRRCDPVSMHVGTRHRGSRRTSVRCDIEALRRRRATWQRDRARLGVKSARNERRRWYPEVTDGGEDRRSVLRWTGPAPPNCASKTEFRGLRWRTSEQPARGCPSRTRRMAAHRAMRWRRWPSDSDSEIDRETAGTANADRGSTGRRGAW